jgi:prepilin-type N-terminal cleavage/methylation domain-containing protein
MDVKGKKMYELFTNNKGFTLIEMAIVLIIIGIIIGAVVKGKDLIRSAEQKKIYTKYTNAWRLCYLNFYDRTGMILGDRDATKDGQADSSSCTQLVEGDTINTPPNFYGLLQIGLNPPTTNGADACTYRYMDSCGGAHDVTITFNWDNTVGAKYNYMLITTIPNELAMAFDTMIDGEADGTDGDFIGNTTDGTAWGTVPCTATTARWKMQF